MLAELSSLIIQLKFFLGFESDAAIRKFHFQAFLVDSFYESAAHHFIYFEAGTLDIVCELLVKHGYFSPQST